VPVYNVTARWTTERGQTKERKISAPFTQWFTADGFFVAKPFQQWLASEVPAVGQADPGNVVEEIGRGSGNDQNLNVSLDNLDKVLAGLKTQGQGGAKARRRA
jgi:Microsomal signal peptidase 25 kDa subunit (SPC25)